MHGIKRKTYTKEELLKKQAKDAPKIQKYRTLTDSVLDKQVNSSYNQESFDLTTKLLNLNPELYTIWNFRRDILTNFTFKQINNDDEDNDKLTMKIIEDDLSFTVEQLYKFPKCYWIWDHRKWLLKLNNLTNLKNELKLIHVFFQSDSRNYHVWQYRRYIIELIINRLMSTASPKSGEIIDEKISLINFNEFLFTTSMINKDISNYSAWHNRSQLTEKLMIQSPISLDNSPEEPINKDKSINLKQNEIEEWAEIFKVNDINDKKFKFLTKELNYINNAIFTDPDDSSVWIYMKWLFSNYFLKDLKNPQIYKLISSDLNNINELNELELEDNNIENKWCLQLQFYLLNILYTNKITDNVVVDGDSEAAEDKKLTELKTKLDSILTKMSSIDTLRVNRYLEYF
ncbi:unnamed protein product [[Candida] boidinii]|uniref:Geranylgeranyl transferase type-2 subunit alpha n=1 Tax=Candida boidinii TaxID=5477 RepID=A0A9W6WEA0_CANBO|nr:unnamed protein product [[Candida] boidinii]GMG00145.1 unnamed protein product [[Candida] boidinii]